jgi:hypothetical protein
MKTTIAFVTALAALTLPVVANAATQHRHHRVVVHAVASDPHVACTESGCGPVPSGCGKRPAGTTGPGIPAYDVVVCPPITPGMRMR